MEAALEGVRASDKAGGRGGRPLIAFFAPVAPYPPPLSGGQIRIDRLIRELLREFEVALVCETPVSEAELASNWELGKRMTRIVAAPRRPCTPGQDPVWGSLWRCAEGALRAVQPATRPASHDVMWSDALVAKARRMFEELPVSAVWASRAWMAEMARSAGGRNIVVDVDDFEGQLMLERVARNPMYKRKPLHWLQAVQLSRYERALPVRYQRVCVCKPEDLDRLSSRGRMQAVVVPNGVDLPTLVRRSDSSSPAMLFVGALWYEPNAEALRWFVREVFPSVRRAVPDVALLVAGRGPLSEDLPQLLSRPGIEVHESPASLDSLYARAAISIAPLLTGGGTSIKVLESLAYEVPTLATPVAVRGLGLDAGIHLAVASAPPAFAAACTDLLTNRERARALAAAGRAEVARRFTWEQAGSAARDAVRSVIQRTNRAQ